MLNRAARVRVAFNPQTGNQTDVIAVALAERVLAVATHRRHVRLLSGGSRLHAHVANVATEADARRGRRRPADIT